MGKTAEKFYQRRKEIFGTVALPYESIFVPLIRRLAMNFTNGHEFFFSHSC
jgi:hypothetical protein